MLFNSGYRGASNILGSSKSTPVFTIRRCAMAKHSYDTTKHNYDTTKDTYDTSYRKYDTIKHTYDTTKHNYDDPYRN
ncbi:MAG: hypothetical protein EOO01_07500 [Chitinophagaceae bacterium]|nr:MAG: hypothetical protein EOO01_07500 [Chitinophagaceae bacterium]